MEQIEARLRAAFRANAETIRSTRSLDLQAARELAGRRPQAVMAGSGPGRRAARGKIAVPLAAAVAVAVIVAAITILPRILPGHGRGHQPGGPTPAFAGAPKFTVVSVVGGLEVVSTTSGRVVGRLAPPRPRQYFTAVTALGNDRTFIVAVNAPSGSCVTWLYQFSLGVGGRPVGFAPFEVPELPGRELNQGGPVFMDLAASADGRLVAFATARCSGSQGHVGVIDIRTRSVRMWTFGGGDVGPYGLSLSANGGLLALVSFSHPDNGHGRGQIDTAWTLRTDSPAGPLTRYWHRVYDSLKFTTTAVAVSRAGAALFAATSRASLNPRLVRIIRVNASSGAPAARPYTFTRPGAQVTGLTLDTSGRYLLVYGWHPQGRAAEYPAVEIDLATGRTRTIRGAMTGYVLSATW